MKYILVFILLAIGISTLLKLRGNYLQERIKNANKEITDINKFRNPINKSYRVKNLYKSFFLKVVLRVQII